MTLEAAMIAKSLSASDAKFCSRIGFTILVVTITIAFLLWLLRRKAILIVTVLSYGFAAALPMMMAAFTIILETKAPSLGIPFFGLFLLIACLAFFQA